MTFVADTRYTCVVVAASLYRKDETSGAMSIRLDLSNDEHGVIRHDIWLSSNDPTKTQATKERAIKTLAEFGITDVPALLNANFQPLIGQTATILTKTHEFNGETSVQTRYLNGPQRKAGGGGGTAPDSKKTLNAALRLFGADDDDPLPF